MGGGGSCGVGGGGGKKPCLTLPFASGDSKFEMGDGKNPLDLREERVKLKACTLKN